MPALCHFFGLQPSEVRAMKMHELRSFTEYMQAYHKAVEEANRG
jgi:hypothetical protein